MRTFIAIDLPPLVQQTLMTIQQKLKLRVDAAGIGRAVRWTPVKKVHLTVRFLGETSDTQSALLATALTELSATRSDFELALQGLDCFPNIRRPSVIWIGIGGDMMALDALQAQIEMVARSVGFDPEQRAYSPHLTIARVQRNANSRSRREVGQVLQSFDQHLSAISFTVDHITHIRSVLKPDGAVYKPLAQYQF